MDYCDMPDVDPAFGHWFAGFIDGEGCFQILRRTAARHGYRPTGYRCRFVMSLRADDGAMLEEIQARTGLGVIYRRVARARPADAPQWRFEVNTKRSCIAFVRLLDRYPLRAKKAYDYALWRQAVLEWQMITQRGPGRGSDWSRMGELKEMLNEGKKFNAEMAVLSSEVTECSTQFSTRKQLPLQTSASSPQLPLPTRSTE